MLCNKPEVAKIYELYLQKMMTEEELDQEVYYFCSSNNITEKKDMGRVMSHLKTQFPGLYDGKIASARVSLQLKF